MLRGSWGLRRIAGTTAGLAAICVMAMALLPATGSAAVDWTSAGHGPYDNRVQPFEYKLSALNAFRLKPKWVFTTHGSESATPVVSGGVVYFPDFGGYMNAVNATTGALIWQEPISNYDGVAGSYSRDSPVIDGNELIFGDSITGLHSQGAHLIAVNAQTGALIWSTQLDSHPAAIVTGSPEVAGGKVLVGVSSNEETAAATNTYSCCTFRGSVVALNPATGAIIWKTYTVPDNGGQPCTTNNPPSGCAYSGGAVWDSPAVDVATNRLYIGTGNNYTAPDAAVACATQALANHTSDANCTSPDDHFDSVLALNLATGAIVWSYKAEGWDAFTLGCLGRTAGTDWCPSPEGPDWDFASGPNLMIFPKAGGGTESIVGAGQKSGLYWAFDAATGKELWSTQLGPGTSLGGTSWGTAYDGKRIYVHEADPYHAAYTLQNGTTAMGGSWAALNPTTGAFDWQTATPAGSAAMGPQSVANGVVFTGSTAPFGPNMYALSAATGGILWRFSSGGSVNSGPAIVNGTVYWGSGYSQLSSLGYSGNDELYAFTIGGQ